MKLIHSIANYIGKSKRNLLTKLDQINQIYKKLLVEKGCCRAVPASDNTI